MKCPRCGGTQYLPGDSDSGPFMFCANCYYEKWPINVSVKEGDILIITFETGEAPISMMIQKEGRLNKIGIVRKANG
jgi:hypothetical protein